MDLISRTQVVVGVEGWCLTFGGWFKEIVTKRKVKLFHKQAGEMYRLCDMAALFPVQSAQNRVRCW